MDGRGGHFRCLCPINEEQQYHLNTGQNGYQIIMQGGTSLSLVELCGTS